MVGQLKEYGFYLKFHGKSLKDFSEGTFYLFIYLFLLTVFIYLFIYLF